MEVVRAIPTAPNAAPDRRAAGTASSDHHECTRPIATITSRNTAEYNPPRSNDHDSSPRAMSEVVSGVASIWSKSLLYLSLKKKLYVASSSAPFMAGGARIH